MRLVIPIFCLLGLSAVSAHVTAAEVEDPRRDHWAWQPIVRRAPPGGNENARNPIDAFVTERLREHGLQMSPPASRRVLIRRLSFDLHGLPPSPETVERFVNDAEPNAYERLVDAMLDSPHYGERLARHWLDIAHYADTHGFERDRRRDHAWRYRDYVIRSFNDDKPYDRFLREQIAGDVLWPADENAIIATGFLAAGPFDYVGQVETQSGVLRRAARALDLDDMTTQVLTATMGVTVNCARCHDHKIDPVSQREYYQLLGVFAGVTRDDRPIATTELQRVATKIRELDQQARRLQPMLDLADIVGGGSGDGSGEPGQGIDPRNGLRASWGMRMGFLSDVRVNRYSPAHHPWVDGVFIPEGGSRESVPVTSTGIHVSELPTTSGQAWDFIRNGPVNSQHSPELAGVWFGSEQHSLIGLHANAGITFDVAELRAVLGEPSLEFSARVGYFGHESPDAYADAWVFVDGQLKAVFRRLSRADGLKSVEAPLPPESRFLTLVSTDGGNGIGMDQIGFGDPVVRTATSKLSRRQQKQLAQLRSERDHLKARVPSLRSKKVYAVVPTAHSPTVRVLRRGDPESPLGEALEPAALRLLPMLDPDLGDTTSSERSRRAALARWITHSDNPLTPRVIVNRLWYWHFGQGIVDTPSDFGLGGGKPSHPKLLDWLADELSRRRGSLKAIQRLMLLSATYRQSSTYPSGAPGVETDSDNRLLWRQNARRIDAESVRDAVLFVSGKLNGTRGGPGFEDFRYEDAYAPIYTYITADRPELWRRSIYRYVVRSTPDRFLTTLDCPNPANMTAKRLQTTTPLQSLTLYNNEFMLQQARYFAQRLATEQATPRGQVELAFELAFGRRPSAAERAEAIAFVAKSSLFSLCRALLNANEFVYVD